MSSRTCVMAYCGGAVDRGLFCPVHRSRLYRGGTTDASNRAHGTTEERYWRRVIRGETERDCWDWSGSKNGQGYASIQTVGRRRIGIHRYSWQLHRGPIPVGLEVMHTCDNPPCSNPLHLRLGTHAQNMADSREKKRTPGFTPMPGEKHPSAKLTDELVRYVRRAKLAGRMVKDLARELGLGESTVGNAALGHSWKHVT